ncbi:hypothetical protein MNBD_NITROSPIRAE01-1743 [hydrothermal vent metagenome]|uniref:Methyltransferase domain-containing protein n=1 Tax=hydrothermal vent metagenome TaxID=652676 RepID=A0A3B1DGA8_9ZZZZ
MNNLERKERIQGIFNDVASRYDRNHFFQISARNLLDYAEFSGKGEMLDVCTGTGNVALFAAQRWPELKIKAIDLSKGMLAQARKKAETLKIKNVDFVFQDAETLKADAASYDLITCAYGLFFFPDISNTFKKVFGLLKPGGSFVFSSFTKAAFGPYNELFLSQLKAYGIEAPKPAITRLQTPEEIRVLCHSVEVTPVEIVSREIRTEISINDWWALIDSAGYKGLLNELGSERLPAFKTAHFAALEKIAPQGKLLLIADSLYGIVKR